MVPVILVKNNTENPQTVEYSNLFENTSYTFTLQGNDNSSSSLMITARNSWDHNNLWLWNMDAPGANKVHISMSYILMMPQHHVCFQ